MQITDLAPLFPKEMTEVSPLLIAGPCSAESRRQVIDTACALASNGIRIFRAGVWKPRTKPGGFEGIGTPALEWIAEAGRITGMLTATEVATGQHLQEAAEAGINAVWIGARTTANPFAVQEIADTFAAFPDDVRKNLAVMVKNPVNADIELWIGAIERIYGAGIRRLGAIHRGFSSYGPHLYRNPPEWSIPIELHRRLPELTLLCDPSHIGGSRELVAPLARRALDMNFDGLIIESHCSPDEALSDSAQQIRPDEITKIRDMFSFRKATDKSHGRLDELREQIDDIDGSLIEILSRRMSVARQIGLLKKELGMKVVQHDRYSELIRKRLEDSSKLGMNPEFMKRILAMIHEESVRQQLDIAYPADDKEKDL